jgi:hypothetical protein
MHSAAQINIVCPSGSTIKITSAFYGRSDDTTCVTEAQAKGFGSDTWSNTGCSLAGALDAASALCDGQASCTLMGDNKTWGEDPCFGTYKVSKVAYICRATGAPHGMCCGGVADQVCMWLLCVGSQSQHRASNPRSEKHRVSRVGSQAQVTLLQTYG